ncbi:hypothetical protein GCM10010911_48330 [Paenibacillus nasutitermitis]|uniref:DUF2809 domain-containing protein n=2 Tax=Paenibacillus nasutitermitis TaxID=1652958 RepID=A0A917E0G2_9BACL|nr:hypothetical protein GCM10010911_48330 [Paenibacillus nasutitermitis]
MYYLVTVLIVMILGISSRSFAESLPVFVSSHFGDALWAGMIYFGFRFLWVHASLRRALALSLIFCFAIEFSQLYQAGWINDIRSTLLGGLILGKGFLAVDLIRYSAGILISYGADWYVRMKGSDPI